LPETDSYQADWVEIQRWVTLADVALNRWSEPTTCNECDDAQKAA